MLYKKMKLLMKLLLVITLKLPLYIIAIPVVVVIRLIRPWLLVRMGGLISSRLGHFAANTELHLCEMDADINVPRQHYVDFFYMAYDPICNQQLAIMWKRVLPILPSWFMAPIDWVNRLIPGGSIHEIGNNTQHDRDVHNLLDRFPPHLKFTEEELARGENGLQALGIPPGSPFVCLTVRDSAYLAQFRSDGNYVYSHDEHRDCNVQNFVLAAEELANRGYFVIRMGAKVRESMESSHTMVIDYATNGMRNDFMDIYLGAKCWFCISVGTGFDAVPYIFRRPIVYVNFVPLGYLLTFRAQFLGLIKHHYAVAENRELTLCEIFSYGIGLSLLASDYDSKGIKLRENTPEEIRDLVVEMEERLNGTWVAHPDDEILQKRFREMYPTDVVDVYQGRPLHGKILSLYSANFLRNNRDWLQ